MLDAREPLVLHPADTVAILTARAPEGSRPLGLGVPLSAPVAAGHKIARTAIAQGGDIVKFGQIIGYATRPIEAGEHVHSHNCAFGAHDQDYHVGVDLAAAQAAIPRVATASFQGYRRANGQVGTRNMIAVCATVNCSATVIRRAADEVMRSGVLADYPNVDGVVAFAHGTGCGMAAEGPGFDNLQRVLWGHATHPNVGAAVFVGLGCEVMQVGRMKSRFGTDLADRFHGLTIQETGGTTKTVAMIVEQIHALLPEVNRATREPVPASELRLALQCGGSDGYSGITANPALGVASDLLVGLGGTAILAETPEIYGAEQLLHAPRRQPGGRRQADRAHPLVGELHRDLRRLDRQQPLARQQEGGLTTILEKSLGAVAKGGSTPLTDVYQYAETVTEPGFVFMDTPGYDPVVDHGPDRRRRPGRGLHHRPRLGFGCKPAPTIKVATNTGCSTG